MGRSSKRDPGFFGLLVPAETQAENNSSHQDVLPESSVTQIDSLVTSYPGGEE